VSSSPLVARVTDLLDLPGVAEAVEEVREACTRLRWHEGLRRRTPEAAAESRVRGATASALLEGAEPAGSRGSVAVVRDHMRGALPWPDPLGPVDRVVKAAAQVTAATEGVEATVLRSPAQVLARLHLAAAVDLLPADQVGRPRRDGEDCDELTDLGAAPAAGDVVPRLALLADLLATVRDGAPAVLVAGLVHAEVATVRPFVRGNGLVARALDRAVVRATGIDPTGVAVVELGHAARAGVDYRGGLASYATGGPEGVRLWLLQYAAAMVRAAVAGERVADDVRSGRWTPADG
jgi:Fic family protein